MSLPDITPVQIAPFPTKEPVKKIPHGSNLDDLLNQLNTPKQDFTPPPAPGASPGTSPAGGNPSGFWGGDEETQEVDPLDPLAAQRQGERIARAIDGGLSFTAAFYAKESEADKYKASAGELKDMGQAWADISQEYNVKINPWINVIFLILMVYGPKFMQASNDRRFNLLNSRYKDLESRVKEMEKEEKKKEDAK